MDDDSESWYGGRVGRRNGVGQDVDVANYLRNYGFFDYRKEMLCDRVCMDAYYNAIFKNKEHFHGKTVLNVGARNGILAIWCAQAGAKKVYAVEATKWHVHARELVKANNLQDVVEVIEGLMKNIELPGEVDVIISDWMGNFLIFDSMIDSVIYARDRWLKPDGVMYPSHACMWMAPIRIGLGDLKLGDFEYCMDDWHNLVEESETYYHLDLGVLTKPFSEGQKKYFMQTSILHNLHPKQVIGTHAFIKEIDCLTATLTEIFEVRKTYSSSIITEQTWLCGFAGWFDVFFRDGNNSSSMPEIKLTTAPSIDKGTYWGQQVFLLHHSVLVKKDDALNISFSLVQSKEEKHLPMEVEPGCQMKVASDNLGRTDSNSSNTTEVELGYEVKVASENPLGYEMRVASDNLGRTDSSNIMLNPESTGWDSNSGSDTLGPFPLPSSRFFVLPRKLQYFDI